MYLPCHEADRLDDGGLYDLLAGQYAPRHSIRSVRVSVGTKVAAVVDDVVCNVDITLDVRNEHLEQLRGHEELKVGLHRL